MHKTRVIIAGGQNFHDYTLLKTKCNSILRNSVDVQIVSGCAGGADTLGERYADEMGYPKELFPVTKADWYKFGKSAGVRRNLQMAKYATHLIAFWDGVSPGTKNMIEEATNLELQVRVIRFTPPPKRFKKSV